MQDSKFTVEVPAIIAEREPGDNYWRQLEERVCEYGKQFGRLK
jgi:hypothetical protein